MRYKPYIAPTGEGGWWWCYEAASMSLLHGGKRDGSELPWSIYKQLKNPDLNSSYSRYVSREEAIADLEQAMTADADEQVVVTEEVIPEPDIIFTTEGGFHRRYGDREIDNY